jgi:hypothetical protein
MVQVPDDAPRQQSALWPETGELEQEALDACRTQNVEPMIERQQRHARISLRDPTRKRQKGFGNKPRIH